MTASTLSTTRTGTGRVLLAGLLAAVLTGVVNAAIAIIAVAAGLTRTMQLMPPIDVEFSVVTPLVGAIG